MYVQVQSTAVRSENASSRCGVTEVRVAGAAVTKRTMQTVRSGHTPSRNLQILPLHRHSLTCHDLGPQLHHTVTYIWVDRCSSGQEVGARELS